VILKVPNPPPGPPRERERERDLDKGGLMMLRQACSQERISWKRNMRSKS